MSLLDLLCKSWFKKKWAIFSLFFVEMPQGRNRYNFAKKQQFWFFPWCFEKVIICTLIYCKIFWLLQLQFVKDDMVLNIGARFFFFILWTCTKSKSHNHEHTVWTVNDVLSRSTPFYWVNPSCQKGVDRLNSKKGGDPLKTSLTVHTVIDRIWFGFYIAFLMLFFLMLHRRAILKRKKKRVKQVYK